MTPRAIQRIYSAKAIDAWMERLLGDWESQFNQADIAAGRKLYRSDGLRAIQAGPSEITVQAKITKVGAPPLYAVVEWEKDHLEVRLSSPDVPSGRGLAVAGLYAMEELIADLQSDEKFEAQTIEERPTFHSNPAKTPKLGRDRNPWKLRLQTHPYGLMAEIIEREGIPEVPALDKRAARLRLMHQLRENGWHFDTKKNHYVLSDQARLRTFFAQSLALWRMKYVVELPEDMHDFSRPAQRLSLGIGKHFELKFLSQEGPLKLSEAQMKELLKSPSKRAFIKGMGWIAWDDDLLHKVRDHSELSKHFFGGWPGYMLFSRFASGLVAIDGLEKTRAQWLAGLESEVKAQLPQWLRPYQIQGVQRLRQILLAGGQPILADEMGLGKTVQVLALLHAFPDEHNRPALIVCPASVVNVWANELRKFHPGTRVDVVSLHTPLADLVKEAPCEQRIILTSYGHLRRAKEVLSEADFGYAVLDEAQAIKNPDSLSAQACCKIRAQYRLAVTGTPIENHPLDVFSLVRFLMPGLLGTRASFERACRDDLAALVKELRVQLTPFILRRLKKDVLTDLPEKMELILSCPLTKGQQSAYGAYATRATETLGDSLDDPKQRFHVLEVLLRLRQICCHPGLLHEHLRTSGHSGKLIALLERLEELFENGHSVVIFSQFTQLLDLIQSALTERFPQVPQWVLTGSTRDRHAPVNAFQTNENGPGVILVSLKAGGVGITLHRADYVFLMDPWWNPAVESQAMDRIHRIGQKNTVTVYRLIAPGTLEEKIEALKETKAFVSADLLRSEDLRTTSVLEHFHTLSQLIDYDNSSANKSFDDNF